MLRLFVGVFFCTLFCFAPPHTHAETSWQQLKRDWPLLWFMRTSCRVHKVVDGDTAHVFCGDKLEKLRLVGIDTPETKHPFKPVEFYGPEASSRAKQLLRIGDNVILALQGRPGGRGRKGQQRGVYGRLLVYIFMPNGRMFNTQMIEEGYAFAMTRYPHTYMERFVQLEQAAKAARRGMWAHPEKVTAMQAEDERYRQLRRACNQRLGVRRFDWVIGDQRTRYYFTKGHRAFFRTDYRTRRLFCSSNEAESAGFRAAPSDYRLPFDPNAHPKTSSEIQSTAPQQDRIGPRDVPPPAPTHSPEPSPTGVSSNPQGSLILGHPTRKTYRVLRPGRYRVFQSVQEAEAAGYRRSGRKGANTAETTPEPTPAPTTGTYARSKRALAERCRVEQPIVGNLRSKIYRTPTSKGYARALRSKTKNTVFFCNEQEAVNAGFRPAKR